jgi:HEAT repeat protein
MNVHRTILRRTAQVLIMLALICRQHSIYAQAGAVAQPNTKDVSKEQFLEDISSTNARVRLDAAFQLDHQRTQLISKLMAILDSPIPDERKMDAVVILGEYRASEAIPLLVNHLLEWQTNLFYNRAALGAYIDGVKGAWTNAAEERVVAGVTQDPVGIALIDIGPRAVPALLDKISQSDDENILGECAHICVEIEGKDVTQFQLQGLLQKETDSKKKERIQSALDILKEFNL